MTSPLDGLLALQEIDVRIAELEKLSEPRVDAHELPTYAIATQITTEAAAKIMLEPTHKAVLDLIHRRRRGAKPAEVNYALVAYDVTTPVRVFVEPV